MNTDKLDYEVPELIMLDMGATVVKGGGSFVEDDGDKEEGGDLSEQDL